MSYRWLADPVQRRRVAARAALPGLPTLHPPLHAPLPTASGLLAGLPAVLVSDLQFADASELQGFAVGPWAGCQGLEDHPAGLRVDADWREEAERAGGVTRAVGAEAGSLRAPSHRVATP